MTKAVHFWDRGKYKSFNEAKGRNDFVSVPLECSTELLLKHAISTAKKMQDLQYCLK